MYFVTGALLIDICVCLKITLIAETFAEVKRLFSLNYTQFSAQMKFC
jgi:hypothetical protein